MKQRATLIERAFEMAAAGATLAEVTRHLKREGFASYIVDASLSGRGIRSQLDEIRKAHLHPRNLADAHGEAG